MLSISWYKAYNFAVFLAVYGVAGALNNTSHLDCDGKFMTYAAHSGWGNQLIELQHGIELAAILNRTLVLPPMIPHKKAAAYGTCSKGGARHLKSPVIRRMAFGVYRKMSPYVDLTAVLDINRISKIAPVVDFKTWHQICEMKYNESDHMDVDHHCTDHESWAVGDTLVQQYLPKGVTAVSLDDLKHANEKVLAFASLFSSNLFGPEFGLYSVSRNDGELASMLHVGRRTIYQRHHFIGACTYAEQMKPYSVIHVRGGDGKYKSREGQKRARIEEELIRIEWELSNTTLDPQKSSCPNKPIFRMFIMTDVDFLKSPDFTDTNEWKTGVMKIEKAAAKQGFGFMITSLRGAKDEVWQAGPTIPGSQMAIIYDTMFGSLADVSFSGTLQSTLSRHVYTIRHHWTPTELCEGISTKRESSSGCVTPLDLVNLTLSSTTWTT